MVFVAIDWSRGSRPPSGAQPCASRGEQKKMRPKAGGIYHVGREAHPTAPGGGRDPRDDTAKIAFLKSVTLKTLKLLSWNERGDFGHRGKILAAHLVHRNTTSESSFNLNEESHDRHGIEPGIEEVVRDLESRGKLQNFAGENFKELGLFFCDGVRSFSHGCGN